MGWGVREGESLIPVSQQVWLCSDDPWHAAGSGSHWQEFFVTMSLSPLISDPVWNVSAIVWLNILGNNILLYYDFWWWQILSWGYIFPLKSDITPLKSDITSLLLSHYCHIFCVFFAVLLLLVLVEQLRETLKPLDTKKKKKTCLLNFNSFPFQKLDIHGAVWEFSLLLPCCHQMELTSGCYTVLCHCAYAQNMLTAKLQTWTGSKTGVPPHGRLHQLCSFPGTGHQEYWSVQRHKGQSTTQL